MHQCVKRLPRYHVFDHQDRNAKQIAANNKLIHYLNITNWNEDDKRNGTDNNNENDRRTPNRSTAQAHKTQLNKFKNPFKYKYNIYIEQTSLEMTKVTKYIAIICLLNSAFIFINFYGFDIIVAFPGVARFDKITIKIVSFLIGFNNTAGTFVCFVYPGLSRSALSQPMPASRTFRFGAAVSASPITEEKSDDLQKN